MAILLNPGTYGSSPEDWLAAFRRELPGMDIRLWPDAPQADAVEFVIATRHEPADLHKYPNLRALLAMGAGIEQYMSPDMPAVPIVRLAEPHMYDEMAAYVIHWVVHFQHRMDVYLEYQSRTDWRPERHVPSFDYPVAVLGFGHIGRRIGESLHKLGFPINAWSRSGPREEWANSYAGEGDLESCLASSAAVVNVLPSTERTHQLMNAARFGQCRPGALLINLGRGATVDEVALLAALDNGQIGYAVLDVTDPEPLPAASPLWSHPRVRITPHIAGQTVVGPAARVIAANVRRILRGEAPFPVVERSHGY
jgi:glyoxylate/hydroxypyruvate reductase A